MHRPIPDRSAAQTQQGILGSRPGHGVTSPVTLQDNTTLIAQYPFLEPSPNNAAMGLIDHYEIREVLGEGGMGVVFRAHDLQLQRMVALKIMKPVLGDTGNARQRFMDEARAMASLNSDNVVAIHQIGEQNNVPYFAMELLAGQSLAQWLAGNPVTPIPTLIKWAVDICNGLSPAHDKQLIHRDIKPANLWLDSAGDRIKILDFGLAYAMDTDCRHTQTGHIIGTLEYMAPEVFEAAPITYKFDLFSLGCVLYQLLSNTSPFAGASQLSALNNVTSKTPLPLQQLRHDLPFALGQLINQLLSKEPEKRPGSAREVCQRLQQISQQTGPGQGTHGAVAASVSARPASRSMPLKRAPVRGQRQPEKTRRNPFVNALALAVGVVITTMYYQSINGKPEALATLSPQIMPLEARSRRSDAAPADDVTVFTRQGRLPYPAQDSWPDSDLFADEDAEPAVFADEEAMLDDRVESTAGPEMVPRYASYLRQKLTPAPSDPTALGPPPEPPGRSAGALRPPPPPRHRPPDSRPPPRPWP